MARYRTGIKGLVDRKIDVVPKDPKDLISKGQEIIAWAKNHARENIGVELDTQQALDYATKAKYGITLSEKRGTRDDITFARAGDGKELLIKDFEPQNSVITDKRKGSIIEGNEDIDFAFGGSEAERRLSEPQRTPTSREDYTNFEREITSDIRNTINLAKRGGVSGTREEALELYALAEAKRDAAARDGIYEYDTELRGFIRPTVVPSRVVPDIKSQRYLAQMDRDAGQKIVDRDNKLSYDEIESAIRRELSNRFSGNDTFGSPIRSMPVDAYKDAEQQIRAAIMARNELDSPRETSIRSQNYADAMLEARLLMNKAGYAPDIRTAPQRPDYPQITPEALGQYLSDEAEEKINPRSMRAFIKTATENYGGPNAQANTPPPMEIQPVLAELLRRADYTQTGSKVKGELIRRQGPRNPLLPDRLETKEDVIALARAVESEVKGGVRKNKEGRLLPDAFPKYKEGKRVKDGYTDLKDAGFNSIIEYLGYGGGAGDRVGFALGQLMAASAPTRSQKAIRSRPMDLGENYGFVSGGKFEDLGVRGIQGSDIATKQALGKKTSTFKELLNTSPGVVSPEARAQQIAVNADDYLDEYGMRRPISGNEGTRFYNKTGESMPIRIKMAIDQKGYGRENVEKAINAQLRADAAQKKIEDQIRLRNKYTPPAMRQSVGESGTTDVRSRRFGRGVAVNDDLISYPEIY